MAAKLIWKKIGIQYTVTLDGEPKDILGLIMKQSKSFNDGSPCYEVNRVDGIEFKKFDKLADAKKYIVNFLQNK